MASVARAGFRQSTGARRARSAHRVDLASQPWFFAGNSIINGISSYEDLITIPEWDDGLLAEAGAMAPVMPTSVSVDETYPFTANVQVGDILLESFLLVEVELDNDQLFHDVEGDFLHTASAILAPTTPGARLVARSGVVPEPLSLLLVVSGMAAVVVVRRRSA